MSYPTTYPDVNSSLQELLSGVQIALGDRFVGLYLYGSLATGDFDPNRSDIDFVVVTTGKLPEEMISALGSMHTQLAASGSKWAKKLEGTYLPQTTLRRYKPDDGPFPCINEGKYYLAHHENDWIIQRHVLREHGVVVAGPALLQDWIDPVGPDELRRAVLKFLREWWVPMLKNPDQLHSREYQAYATLSMCRALYTIQYGSIVSKSAAAAWAQDTLDKHWTGLIVRALAWPRGEQLNALDNTLGFIRYVLKRSEQIAAAQDLL